MIPETTVRRYRAWMLANGCAPGTADKGLRYLAFFERERGLDLSASLTYDGVIEFLARWRDNGVRPRTLNSWIRELNLWARFNRLGWKLPYFRRRERPLLKVPDEDLVRRLLALRWPDRSVDARNRLMLRVLAEVGPRRNELVHLETGDLVELDRGPGLLIRHGKGEKERALPISEDLATSLREYMSIYRASSRSRSLFTTRSGGVSHGYLARIVQKAGASVGAPWLSPHKLRHFVVDYALDHGISIGSVAELMGHARWETTQLYRQRRLAKQQMEREFRALKPLPFPKEVPKWRKNTG